MSFSSSVKQELCQIHVKNICCRRALLYGIMLSAAFSEERIAYHTDLEVVSALVSRLVRECGGREDDVVVGTHAGRPRYTHAVHFQKLVRFLESFDGGEAPAALFGKSCVGCSQAFLRGIFLSMGTVSDPTRSYHAELLIGNEKRAERIDEFLATLGLSARRIVRGNRVGLYYKSSTAIEELFAEMGGSTVVFRLANAKIERDIRNNENRATNCDARNIARSVGATQLQIAAIETLALAGTLETLSADLYATAMLRMEYSEDSLAELAARHEPPISKSGLNHRLATLRELADKINKR